MRFGGCWSATSCQTSRGIDTMSTWPGGWSPRRAASRRPPGPPRSRRAPRRAEARTGPEHRARPVVMTGGGGPGRAPRSRRPARRRPRTRRTASRPAAAMAAAAAGSASSAATAPARARASPIGHDPTALPLPDAPRGRGPTGVATTGRGEGERLGQHERARLPDRRDDHDVGRGQLVGRVVARAGQGTTASSPLARIERVSSPDSGPSPTMATSTATPRTDQQRGGLDRASGAPSAGAAGRRRRRAPDRRRRRAGLRTSSAGAGGPPAPARAGGSPGRGGRCAART